MKDGNYTVIVNLYNRSLKRFQPEVFFSSERKHVYQDKTYRHRQVKYKIVLEPDLNKDVEQQKRQYNQ